MRRQHVDVRVHSKAEPQAVYALLRDGSTWPAWAQVDSFELERHGEGEPEGPGAVRVFRRGRVVGRDEIVDFDPDRRFRYRNVSGLPIRDYQAEVELAPADGGTAIRWRTSFLPKIPGTGWFWRLGMTRFIRRTAGGLAEHAPTTPRH